MKNYVFGAIVMILLAVSWNSLLSQESQTLVVANKTGETVTTVYVSPAGTNSWGTSINTKDKLLSGEMLQYTQKIDNTKCTYDLKFTLDDGKEYIMPNLNLCTGGTILLDKSGEKDKTK